MQNTDVFRWAFLLSGETMEFLWLNKEGNIIRRDAIAHECAAMGAPKCRRPLLATICLLPEQVLVHEKIIPAGLKVKALQVEIEITLKKHNPIAGQYHYYAYLKSKVDTQHDLLQIYSVHPDWVLILHQCSVTPGIKVREMIPPWLALKRLVQSLYPKCDTEILKIYDAGWWYRMTPHHVSMQLEPWVHDLAPIYCFSQPPQPIEHSVALFEHERVLPLSQRERWLLGSVCHD